MFAYIDESGNTGLNLFDPDQPYFVTVAMSSPVDFDAVFRDHLTTIVCQTGKTYLHASEMGMQGVEAVAKQVTEIIDASGVRFHFYVADKADIAVMKFFDAIFDPGENPAAPPFSYPIRVLRLVLLLKFAAILDTEDTKLFWNAMTGPRSASSESDAVEAIENVIRRIWKLPDARSRELIGDSLEWGRTNIGRFSFWTDRKETRYGHLPNLFSLPALFSGISRDATDWGCEIDAIIHDQQSQFEQTLREWHSLFEGLEPERIFHFGDTPIKFGNIQGSRFEMGDTRQSPGLQLVDTVLWAFSRSVSGKPLGPDTIRMIDLCFSSNNAGVISLDWVGTELNSAIPALINRPMSNDQLWQGMKIVERGERVRQKRMLDDYESKTDEC